jgi:hypothetical protein
MKKHVKEFLNYLEKETMLQIESLPFFKTTKFFNRYGNPINADEVVINGEMTLLVHSCGCNQCKQIIGMQLFYRHSSKLVDAEDVMMKIKKIVPTIPIVLVDEFEALREAQSNNR